MHFLGGGAQLPESLLSGDAGLGANWAFLNGIRNEPRNATTNQSSRTDKC